MACINANCVAERQSLTARFNNAKVVITGKNEYIAELKAIELKKDNYITDLSKFKESHSREMILLYERIEKTEEQHLKQMEKMEERQKAIEERHLLDIIDLKKRVNAIYVRKMVKQVRKYLNFLGGIKPDTIMWNDFNKKTAEDNGLGLTE